MIRHLHTLASAAAMLVLAACPLSAMAGDDDDDDDGSGGGIVIDSGLVFEGTAECTSDSGALTVFKDITVCFDPLILGGDDDDDDDVDGDDDDDVDVPAPEVCDPFPDDGLFTYVYKIRNDATSLLGTVGLEVTVLLEPGAIVDAGVLPSDGVAPSSTFIETDRVSWFFAEAPIMPGEMSQLLYIVSPLGPEEVPFSVVGEFGVDCTGACIGPGVVCELCPIGGDDDDDDDRDDDDDEGPGGLRGVLFSCPSGPAAGTTCDDFNDDDDDDDA